MPSVSTEVMKADAITTTKSVPVFKLMPPLFASPCPVVVLFDLGTVCVIGEAEIYQCLLSERSIYHNKVKLEIQNSILQTKPNLNKVKVRDIFF